MNKFRNIGYFIDSMLGENSNNRADFCKFLGFSAVDLDRLCEGRIGLTPVQVEKTASFLKKNVSDILRYSDSNSYANQIHCRTNFSNSANCDKILDIIDSYIDVKEAI